MIPDTLNILGLCLPIALDLIAITLYFLFERAVTAAASLRNHFDNTVLGFENIQDTNTDPRKLQSLVIKATTKNSELFQAQISNTGRDDPPGVKDWYEFSKDYSDSDVVFECQKQNQWWNKEINKRSTIVIILILAVAILGAFPIFHFSQTPWYKAIVCILSLVLTFFDRIIENLRYCRLSLKIENTCNLLSISKDEKLIKALQDMIESRREIHVTELNIVHKRKSKQLSKEYSFISKCS